MLPNQTGGLAHCLYARAGHNASRRPIGQTDTGSQTDNDAQKHLDISAKAPGQKCHHALQRLFQAGSLPAGYPQRSKGYADMGRRSGNGQAEKANRGGQETSHYFKLAF